MKKIEVVAYSPLWKDEFEKAKKAYTSLLEGLEYSIEHVGSTSVEGLWAKPVLDIDILVSDEDMSDSVIQRLETVGYKHRGNLGIEGREAMGYKEDNEFIDWMKHHLYVCIEDSENVKNHFLLRRHLRENEDAVLAYSELKKELAKKFPYNINAYIDGKTDLIKSFLEKEGLSKDALNRIEEINKNEKI